MAPRVRVGDYVWIDPAEPAAHGRFVAVRDPGRGEETVVRLLIERDGRRILRALDGRCPERTAGAGNDTDIRGVTDKPAEGRPAHGQGIPLYALKSCWPAWVAGFSVSTELGAPAIASAPSLVRRDEDEAFSGEK